MNMDFFTPVQIITGKDCIKNNPSAFRSCGKKCLIVTGSSSAKKSGALDDVVSVLTASGTEFMIYDKIEQNPSYDSCKEAAEIAKQFHAEFIVGIGGGSPLDAAKAIAVLAVNADTSANALFSMDWDAKPLPIVVIGTTAGTGSEVTPVSIITSPAGMKTSLRSPDLYPAICFGDPSYTMSLSPEFTRSTALDALCHCLESYWNKTANDISQTLALRGIDILLEMLEKTAICQTVSLTYEDREKLYFASLYAGLAIGVTGTAFPHALGYFLSEQYGICHGNACACYLEDFINYNTTAAPAESQKLFTALGTNKESVLSVIRQNLPDLKIKLTEEKITELAPRFEDNKSLKKCHGTVNRDFAVQLLKKRFL